MKIIVPATSANIGPGFDSVGVALSKYLAVEVLEHTNEWIVEHQLEHVPSDQNNLLIRDCPDSCKTYTTTSFKNGKRYSLSSWLRFI